ncbi:MAG TPA: FGGY-family carbohydrate kinase [Rectinemataceae bacterium]|nr:FGGY-family carbohydrate kinase [Rectinemataceae bacterium]
MQACFLGIDSGGSLTKAAIFDESGRQLASAARRMPSTSPGPGRVERDMELLWSGTCDVVREALAASGLPADGIRAVACTGHGKGLYLWGREGRPAYPGIVSTDSRAWEYSRRWEEDGTASRAFSRTFQRLLACQPPSLLAWLKDHEPAVLESARWVFEVKDYLRFRLTGQAFAEISDYSGSSLMNLEECRFDSRLLAEFGLEEVFDLLPPLRWSTDICGQVSAEAARATGLRAGTPVAGGMFDIDACALATGVLDESRLCVVAGTWGINEWIARRPVLDGSVMMNSLFCVPGSYVVEESSPTSASNYEWFVTLCGEDGAKSERTARAADFERAERLVAELPPGVGLPVYLPYLFGSNYNPRARACFVGLEPEHSEAQLLRAVMEGVVYCHVVHIEKLLAAGARPEAIRLAGGAARSPSWTAIFADVTALPVETSAAEELGTLGCAMAAAVASGFYADLREAAARMTHSATRVEPEPLRSGRYRENLERYKRASQALERFWDGGLP